MEDRHAGLQNGRRILTEGGDEHPTTSVEHHWTRGPAQRGRHKAVTDTSTASSTSSDDGNGALTAGEGPRDDNLGSQRAHTETRLVRIFESMENSVYGVDILICKRKKLSS